MKQLAAIRRLEVSFGIERIARPEALEYMDPKQAIAEAIKWIDWRLHLDGDYLIYPNMHPDVRNPIIRKREELEQLRAALAYVPYDGTKRNRVIGTMFRSRDHQLKLSTLKADAKKAREASDALETVQIMAVERAEWLRESADEIQPRQYEYDGDYEPGCHCYCEDQCYCDYDDEDSTATRAEEDSYIIDDAAACAKYVAQNSEGIAAAYKWLCEEVARLAASLTDCVAYRLAEAAAETDKVMGDQPEAPPPDWLAYVVAGVKSVRMPRASQVAFALAA